MSQILFYSAILPEIETVNDTIGIEHKDETVLIQIIEPVAAHKEVFRLFYVIQTYPVTLFGTLNRRIH